MPKDYMVPTGNILKEYLTEYRISQKELCARIGMSEKHVSKIITGKSRLTEEFALRIEKVIAAVPASYWLNYEAKYREYIARSNELVKINESDLSDIARRFRFKEVFSDLGLTLQEMAIEMLRLLKISDFANFEEAYSKIAVDFMEDGGEKEAIAIWLNLCETEIDIQNEDLDNTVFNPNQLEKSLNKFKLIASNENIQRSIDSCRKLCNKLGIYLVMCETITNSKVRGALTTYRDHPAILLSSRYKSHDHIWFALIHELAHLVKHYNKKDILVTREDYELYDDVKEREASEFASDFFIGRSDFERFIDNGRFDEHSVREFAKKEGVAPGIVVGRLQHDKYVDFSRLTHLKVFM